MAKRQGQHNSKAMVYRSPELERAILDELCSGRSLTSICAQPGYPTASAVVRWAAIDPDFRRRYLEAKQVGMTLWADTMVEEAEDELGSTSMAAVQARHNVLDTKK